MYILNKSVAWAGIVIAALSTVLCPFLRAPLVGNWNLYETDFSLFFITNGILAVAVLFLFLRKVSVYRIVVRVFAVWCVVALSAVYFKINNYFGVKIFDGALANTLHIKWGWGLLFLAAAILLFSVRRLKEVK